MRSRIQTIFSCVCRFVLKPCHAKMTHGIIGMMTKGMVPGRSQKQVKCRFCPHIMSYRGDRMLAHLGYRLCLGASRDVSICRMVPLHIRVLFEEYAGVVPKPVGIGIEDPHVEHDVPLEPILSQLVNREREPLQMSQTTSRSNTRV